ncbi:MAG TPA: FHA domain-containing protein [Pirellulales bacterium]|jgi:pSer/pThr/pTyr-binding forkhead associated (FHA) protein|nr:FHA domain-containing protein [Pirellulales bacterium]
MEVRLKVLVGKNSGQELSIPGPRFFIGRAEDCQLRPRSDLISRHHCVLLIEDGFVAIRDFGSKNGTVVNGQRIVGERELKPGDHLTIGPLEFEVVLPAPVVPKKRPKVESVKEAAARTAEGHGPQGGDEKLDVSQWLGDGGSGDSKVLDAETRVIHMNETGEIDVGNGHAHITPSAQTAPESQTSVAQTPVAQKTAAPKPEAQPVSAKAPSAGKTQPGKLPPIPKGNSGDSRDAAADVLNKFFKRR